MEAFLAQLASAGPKHQARWRRTVFRLVWWWFPLILWAVWIYWLSSRPSLPHPARRVGVSDYLFDYVAHGVNFAVLTFLSWRVVRQRRWTALFGMPSSAPMASVVALTYAATDEWHQSFVPGRTASIKDWLADAAGILVALIVLAAWDLLRRGRARPG